MSSNQLSSGDVLADRRADYARMMGTSGDHAGAADLMEQALELAPRWAAGWFQLGEYREKSGNGEGAVTAYEIVLELDPADLFGAGLKLALLTGNNQTTQPSSRYVERLFDDYASRFDKALVERLGYDVPQKLAALVRGQDRRFALTVDLGCGTGLFGAEIRDLTARLEGFDLSRNMLREAGEKGLYDHLGQADLSLSAAESGLFSWERPPASADLVSAADVLMYLGDLTPPLSLAREMIASGGLLAFSVEDAGEGENYRLGPSLRFAHGSAYVRTLLAGLGFALLEEVRTVIRQDAGQPVHGILYLAQAPAA